jgi:hypothetical protein
MFVLQAGVISVAVLQLRVLWSKVRRFGAQKSEHVNVFILKPF